MCTIIKFPDKKAEDGIDNRSLSPELIREYMDTIMLVDQFKDSLMEDDWKHAYGMLLNFNYLLLNEIGRICQPPHAEA